MEDEFDKSKKLYEERKTGIKVLADQMAKRYLGYDEEELKDSGITKDQLIKILNYPVEKDNLSSIKESETEYQNPIKKFNQIQDNNSNINTNINTKENNQNTIINTIINTGTNQNTNPNNINENEITSNIYTKRSQESIIDELINDYKNSFENKEEIDISIQKISKNNLDISDSSSDDNNTKTIYNKITKPNEKKKKTIYDRSINDLMRKESKLEKKRKEFEKKKLNEVKLYPIIDPNSEAIIEKKDYVPIEIRAGKIHSMKIFQNIMNEQRKKVKKQQEEMAQIAKRKNKFKKFDQDDWDEFVMRQENWDKNVQYKKKAAMLIRISEENENYFKPKINSRSKTIIEEIEEENKNYIDEVYYRLYNDFEEHKERQKFRNQQSLPTFRPKILKCSSQKSLGYSSKRINRYETNPLMYLKNKNKTKKSYIFNNSMDKKSTELFIDSCNNIHFKNRNVKYNNKYLKFINKSQKTEQQSKNNFSNINCSQVSSGLINSNYIIVDSQKTNQSGKTKKNSSAPFLPLNIKKMIEKNCKDDEEEKLGGDSNINRKNEINLDKYINNYSLYNMEESKEKTKNDKYNESEIELKFALSEKNESELMDKLNNLYNNNSSEIKSKEEIFLDESERNKRISSKKKSDIIDSEEDSNKNQNSFYQINIRDTTPHLIKENKILASKDYSDFFDIPDLEEDI